MCKVFRKQIFIGSMIAQNNSAFSVNDEEIFNFLVRIVLRSLIVMHLHQDNLADNNFPLF